LLKPLVGAGPSTPEQSAIGPEPPPEQELARVDSDLGVYLDKKEMDAQAAQLNEQAIQIVDTLKQKDPENYEYKMEAATYYFNLACSLADEHQLEQAKKASVTASQLFDELAAPSVAIQVLRAENNTLSAWIDKESKGAAKPAAKK
jgi:hypothetical protein